MGICVGHKVTEFIHLW